jgi:hypothetical protein
VAKEEGVVGLSTTAESLEESKPRGPVEGPGAFPFLLSARSAPRAVNGAWPAYFFRAASRPAGSANPSWLGGGSAYNLGTASA